MSIVSYEQAEVAKLDPPYFLNENDRNNFLIASAALFEVKNFLDKINLTALSNAIPIELNTAFQQLKDEFAEKYSKLAIERQNASTEVAARNFIINCNSVIDYKNKFFEPHPHNRNLFICNSILSFADNHEESISKINILTENLNNEIRRSQLFNKELEEKSAKFVVSNYAKAFEQEEIKNKRLAARWLYISLTFTAVGLSLLILSFRYDWFNITYSTQVFENNHVFTKIAYNYPNLITKVLVISIVIYLMSFFFRQYSVNKHLQTINGHRKNALNSYVLFAESIGDKNVSDKSALMLQVSKAIYENSPTGYLPSKQSNDGTGSFIELTKYITENK